MLSEQKRNHDHYPYQVINGKVCNLSIPYRQLEPEEFLVIKPLVPLLVYLTTGGVSITQSFEWCSCAAKKGDLEALQWLRANGESEIRLTKVGAPWDEMVCCNAASSGHLEVFRWARLNGAPWDVFTCTDAALNGHLEVIRWARSNGAPEAQLTEVGAPWDQWVCRYASGSMPLEACWR